MLKTLIKKTRGLKLPAIAVVGVVFALATVLGRSPAPAREPLVTPPSSSFAAAVSGIGVVEPKSEVIAIGTELSGVVRSVHVRPGDVVKAGAPLFTLDARDSDARIATLEAALKVAQIQAEDTQTQFEVIKGISDKRAVSQDDFNRRKFAAALNQARMAQAEADLKQALTTKERLSVTAPIDGTILSVDIRPGEFASAGSLSDPLMRMGDLSATHVRVEIDEENAARISPTASAKGFRRGDTENPIALSFVRIEPFVRAKQNLAVAGQRVDTRVLQVIYAVDGAEQALMVGEQMDVFIESPAPSEE